mmetsp:Transcript_15478/g.36835  ORF Transcript_15478/g.36835 Transcript_15478/m.36835 type:complete len:105 (-) Transcript_15478:711-1025(-)
MCISSILCMAAAALAQPTAIHLSAPHHLYHGSHTNVVSAHGRTPRRHLRMSICLELQPSLDCVPMDRKKDTHQLAANCPSVVDHRVPMSGTLSDPSSAMSPFLL